jgi:predicted permease
MRRSVFFIILVIVGLIFSGLMLFMPTTLATGSGLSGSAETALLFRNIGGIILGVTLCNFLVRNHPDSPTLAAVLWMNLALHVMAILADLTGLQQGVLTIATFLPGAVIHAILAFGCYVFASRMNRA